MIGKKITNWFGQLLMPRLAWIQVEVTSFCNASCVYCPRTVYREQWRDRHLPMSTFTKLIAELPDTDLIFLQGWGEPLLNPHFIEMVKLAKSKGLQVGATTNGTLFNEDLAESLVDAGIDVLAFSLAGASALNDRFRKGANLEKVLAGINLIKKTKDRKGSQLPQINLAYLLLRSGLDDLDALPALLSGLGISQVVVSTLDFVPAEQLKKEAIIPATEEEFAALAAKIEEVAAECSRINVELHCQVFHPGPKRISCTEKPREALFVSADGSVSPCVFTNLPVQDASCFIGYRADNGMPPEWEKSSLKKLNFGNINNLPLHRIWREKQYIAFRDAFFKKKISSPCEDCAKLYLRQTNEVRETGGRGPEWEMMPGPFYLA